MAHTTIQKAQAYAEASKLDVAFGTPPALDADLEGQVSDQVLGQLAQAFDTSTWVDENSTPKLVQNVVAMYYVAWLIDRTYGVNEEANDTYAGLLLRRADQIVAGLLTGAYVLVDDPNPADTPGQPIFYPTDESTSLDPRDFPDDTSVGPAAFSMGQVF